MKHSVCIDTAEDITLITLKDSPAEISFIAEVLESIASGGVNIDMIAQTAPISARTTLSFTIPDDEMGTVLEAISGFRTKYKQIKPVVSSGNVKLLVSSEEMRTTPGIASQIFRATANAGADIRLVTTSEVDVSLLLTKADSEAVRLAIWQAFE